MLTGEESLTEESEQWRGDRADHVSGIIFDMLQCPMVSFTNARACALTQLCTRDEGLRILEEIRVSYTNTQMQKVSLGCYDLLGIQIQSTNQPSTNPWHHSFEGAQEDGAGDFW